MNTISDTVQTLASVALFASGSTRVRGVAHNRFKETDRIADLAAGRSPIDDVSDDELQAVVDAGAVFTSDPAVLADADAILVCVPSPLGRNRQPDLSFIEAAADTVRSVARAGQLICLESTTYPGTTEDYLVPAVTGAGLKGIGCVDREHFSHV